MTPNLSPKDLALMIGVSESSLKRWVDEGRLSAGRTAGGHRRIPLHEAVRFIRQTSQDVMRPEMLGLGEGMTRGMAAAEGGGSARVGGAEAALLHALETGDAEQARGLIVGQFLANKSVAGVFDGPIAYGLHRIGELWQHTTPADHGIMIEHRAVEICVSAVHQVRAMLAPVDAGARVALGGAAPGDPYQMPSLMASTVLMECGYRDVNLGPNVPIETMVHAIRQQKPALVWWSSSVVIPGAQVSEHVRTLAAAAREVGAVLAMGGRGLFGQGVPIVEGAHLVASMSELAAMARGLDAVKHAGAGASQRGNGLARGTPVRATR